jgi:23S rRNA (adenine2503-C2)-methyltransferase
MTSTDASPDPASPPVLRAMDLPALTGMLQRAGQPAYRARQLLQWIYEKGARDFAEMTNLPKDLRAWLAEHTTWGGLELADTVGRPDETQKLVFRTDDSHFIESVLMRGDEETEEDSDDGEPPAKSEAPEPPRGSTPPRRRLSLCVSSQVGCPLACAFCMTGLGGFRRNLRVDEILDQVLTARRLVAAGEQLSNLVFMGMGEPMLNLEAVLPALKILTLPEACNIATRRVTVSTAGLIEGIEEFGRAGTGVNLAVSLNATTQEVRDHLMPGCRRWPIADLLNACRRFPLVKRRRITFEYVLLDGVNDTDADARRLAKLLHGIPCKVNLILYNDAPELPHRPTGEAQAERFRLTLVAAHYTASVRRSKGRDYSAACGQLAAHFRHAGAIGDSKEEG